jgi:hypothetical protein
MDLKKFLISFGSEVIPYCTFSPLVAAFLGRRIKNILLPTWALT